MTDKERNNYIKASILAAVSTAGIGALIRSQKAKERRAKILDPTKSKNAIIVPIKIDKFMEGILTPDEQSKEAPASLPAIAPTSSEAVKDMPEADINALKRDILRGRKMDFFKSSSADSVDRAEDDNGAADDNDDKGDKDEDAVTASESKDGRVLLRDQEGKFVSPTDPIAVQQVEKSATDGDAQDKPFDWGKLTRFFTHPIESAGVVGKAFIDRPLMLTAGMVGSVYLAAKISDAINKRRRRESEARLDDARERYVALLEKSEGSEKMASDDSDPRGLPGTVLGTAFLVPMAITAMITNKIIDNRNEDKRKRKEMSDSYPDDPVILYKTSEDKEIELTPEAALALITVKSAMIMAAEIEETDQLTVKKADDDGIGWLKDWGSYIVDKVNPMSAEEGATEFVRALGDENNNKAFYNIMPRLMRVGPNGDVSFDREAIKDKAVQENFKSITNGWDNIRKGRFYRMVKDPARRREFMNRLRTDRNLNDLLAKKFTDSKYDSTFGKMRKDIVNKKLMGFLGFKSADNPIYKIISWLVNNLGIGKYMFRNAINSKFDAWRKAYGQNGTPYTIASGRHPRGARRNSQTPAATPQPTVTPNAGAQNAGFTSTPWWRLVAHAGKTMMGPVAVPVASVVDNFARRYYGGNGK